MNNKLEFSHALCQKGAQLELLNDMIIKKTSET